VDKFKKHLVQPQCDQKSEASEAAEYHIYDVRMVLSRLKNSGSAGSILPKLGQLIPFQERGKEIGKDEWLDKTLALLVSENEVRNIAGRSSR
jgi:hypothetical protein